MEMTEFKLTVNGAEHSVNREPNAPLLDVLRHDLALSGPKFGCGMGLCGACFVLVDGKAHASCVLPVSAVNGPVVTVEGLADGDELHPVQQAFIDEQAAQCGYCTAGMVIGAVGLLQAHPDPAEQDVRAGLNGHLCRCGTHNRIVRAVLKAAGRPDDGPPAGDVVRSQVPAGGARAGIDETPGSPRPVDTESGVSAAGSALPADLAANPVLARWLDFSRDGEVTLRPGKVEYGQGIWTALAQIAAEELQVDMARVRVAPVSTSTSPNEGLTAGSLSIEDSGAAIRQVCAQVRDLMLTAAASKLGVGREVLDVADGQVRTDNGPTGLTYWTLATPGLLDRPATAIVAGRPPERWSVAGRSAQRLDIPDKVSGQPRFLHDQVFPGMAWGRVVRPPARAATLAELAELDLGADVALIRDGSFLGVVAETDRAALRAAGLVARAAHWETTPSLPDMRALREFLLSAPAHEETVIDRPPDAAGAGPGTRTLTAEFTRPFLAHASIAPSCAIGRWDADSVTVWSHSQGIFGLREAIATGLGMPARQVTVHYVEGAGVYGQNGADDVAMDAALLARAVPSRAVRVEWTREDEMSWSPLGAAMVIRLSAGLDTGGRVVNWQNDVYSNGFLGRPMRGGEPRLLALAHLAAGRTITPSPDGPPDNTIGATRNSVPGYDIPGLRVTRHLVQDMPIRTSSLRGLGAHLNVFAIESLMDELAEAAGADPVAFRLAHLTDQRARQVLAEAARMAGWDTRERRDGIGHGVAVARYEGIGGYCAAVAEVAAETDVELRRLWLAVDVGRVINPDGVLNQVEGGAVQSASWTLREQVTFNRDAITSSNWDSYPILRFTRIPEVMVRLIDAPAEAEKGAGEVSLGPVAGAIGNAVSAAVGVRVRDLPLTSANIAQAIERS
jgi:nicotinate dehydrogenase subunit B